MATIRKFEDIKAWQAARELTCEIYEICRTGNLAQDFGLRDQIRRSAVSIGSNIAEGYGRESKPELMRFLRIAKGSACEFRSQLYTLNDVQYISEEQLDQLHAKATEVEGLIGGFLRYLERDQKSK